MNFKRKKNGQFANYFRTQVKHFFQWLLVIFVLLIGALGVYALVSYKKPVEKKEPKGVIQIIETVCKEENFNPELAIKVAACESYLQPYFIHTNRNKSIDRGLFAFNSYYYKKVSNKCAFSPECATRVFVREAKAGRVNNWLCYKKVKF